MADPHGPDLANQAYNGTNDYPVPEGPGQGPPCGYPMPNPTIVKMEHFITVYMYPLILLQGLVGNLLAMPVLYVIGRRSWSTILYLFLLTMVDLFVLLVRCGESWYFRVTHESLSWQITNSSDAVCRTYHFVFTFVKHLGPWLVVAMSIEMMIATRWPRRTYTMCTKERARNVVLFIVIIVVCIDINFFWTWGIPQQASECMYTEEFSVVFSNFIWPAMRNSVEFILPLLFVSVCFFVTATTMINRRAQDEALINEELSQYFLELNTLKDFRTICLILCVMFMCLALFEVIMGLIQFLLTQEYLTLTCQSLMDLLQNSQIANHFKQLSDFLFRSSKIYLYIAFNSSFRSKLSNAFIQIGRALKKAICKLCRKGRTGGARIVHETSNNGSRKPLMKNQQLSRPVVNIRPELDPSYSGGQLQGGSDECLDSPALTGYQAAPCQKGEAV